MRAPSGYLLAARYRLIEPVGRGGMGTVWRARDELLDRDVAVKEVRLPLVLDEDLRAELCARTEREGRATAMVAHPSVITVFDVITEDDRPWIVMEFLKAQSLEEIVRRNGPLPPREVAEIGRQVLGALRAVHAKGILHRDVKPSNVLVTEDRAVLTDFGLAALEGDASITQAGMVLGSAGYIAPERVLGDKASPAADLWSLGATLYTAVEGRGLHGRRSAAAALAALTSGAPIPMERAGPLAPVLHGLLQIDPAARLDSVRAALMLARVAAGGTVEDLVPPPPRSSARPSGMPILPSLNRRPSHRGQHRADSRPKSRVIPPAPQRGSGSAPGEPFGHQGRPGQFGPQGQPGQQGQFGPQSRLGRHGRTDQVGQGNHGSRGGQDDRPGPLGQFGGPDPRGRHHGPGGTGRTGDRTGQATGLGQDVSYGRRYEGGQPYQTGRDVPQSRHGRQRDPRSPDLGQGERRRRTQDARETPAAGAVRRRPAEGVHRKPAEPALQQVVRNPLMRRLIGFLKIVLPRRYWPRMFVK